MGAVQQTDYEQMRLWNGPAGRAWIEAQDILDQMFRQFEAPLCDVVPVGAARRVLDVGCGTGGVTVAIARRLSEQGRAVGIDISAPMIAAALSRACHDGTSADFVCADAQNYEFEPGSFDTIISRLGVMFFADPVAAFVNLRRAAIDGARLRFIAWRSAAETPFMTTAERAAAPLLPELPARRPDGPGQFAFADPRRIERVLRAAGWTRIDIRAVDVPCSFPANELVRYISWLGPVGAILQAADHQLRQTVVEAVRPAFDGYVQKDAICFTAACWMVDAQTPSAASGEVPDA